MTVRLRLKALDNIWGKVNIFPQLLRKGNIVLIEKRVLIRKYNLDIDNYNKYHVVGLVLSDVEESYHDNVFYKKMYKMLILNNIVNVDRYDIKEKI